MRIGIDARLNYYRPGGSTEYTRHLVRELAQLDPASAYYVVHHARDRHTLCPGPNFRRLNTWTPSHHRWERWSLSLELWPHRLDVYHATDTIPPQRGARRHVLTIHDLHYLHHPQFMTRESLHYYRDQIGWAVQRAAHILVPSHATARDLVTLLGVPEDRVTVHPLGVNDAFRPQPADAIRAVRERWGIPRSYVLFVGTFEPRKNITGLLRAYHRLRADLPDAPPLVLVGRRGWLYEDIFATAEQLRLGEALIWVEDAPFEDLPALYSGALALALPSHYEGFGLTALEAMACGTPPIVSPRGSLPEVVGEAGLYAEPDDTDALADAMRRLLQDDTLRAELRRKGLARAATFTWRRTAEIALRVYRQVGAR